MEPILSSYRFAKKMGESVGMDESHNHIHGKEVLFWATDILPRNMSMNHRRMVGHCALLHDLIDPKYVIVDATRRVEAHLMETETRGDTEDMMTIMKTLSYRKTRHGFPGWLETRPQLSPVFHTVREADLLSSFNLARMVWYRQALGGFTQEKIREEMRELFEERMGRLMERGLFVSERGRTRAGQLEALARLRMEVVLDNLDLATDNLEILMTVSHLNIDQLLKRLAES